MKAVYKKCHYWVKGLGARDDVYIALLILVLALASFGLGRLSKSAETQSPVAIYEAFPAAGASSGVGIPDQAASGGDFVASIKGSKYHFPWCPGAKQMNEENKIWFATKEEAEAAGYTPAGNCKGL